MTPLEAALSFHTRGWSPIPLCWPKDDGSCSCGRRTPHQTKDVGKAPLIAGWQQACPSEDDIREWFGKIWPKANVGIVLAPSKLLAVDTDSPDAYAEAMELGLPPTITRISNNPAFVYARPEGCPMTNSTLQGASAKLDILANSLLVVFGTHRSGRKVYVDDAALAQAPKWAVDMLSKSNGHQVQSRGELPKVLPAIDVNKLKISERIKVLILTGENERYPSRSEALFAALKAMIGEGYDDATIASVILSNPIGEKANEQGHDWLAGEIARARVKQAQSDKPKKEIQSGFRQWKHDDLLAAEFPEQHWIVQNTLPEGSLVMLGGKKKLGKSWLVLQMAQSVAAGSLFLNQHCLQGSVLYLCLEDGERRLNSRLKKQNATAGLPIHYFTRFQHLDDGGLEHLRKCIQEHSPKLTIIDTLAAAKTGRTDENAAGDMGDLVNALRDMAQEHHTTIVVVAHHGKASYGDPGFDIRGSSAVAGAADVNLGLYKTDSGHVLKGEGRDIEPFEIRIEFDTLGTWRWQLVGDTRQIARQENDTEVLGALEEFGEADAEGIANLVGKHRTTVLPVLKRLKLAGLLTERTVKVGRALKIVYSKNDGVSPTSIVLSETSTCPTPSTSSDNTYDGVDHVGGVGHICKGISRYKRSERAS